MGKQSFIPFPAIAIKIAIDICKQAGVSYQHPNVVAGEGLPSERLRVTHVSISLNLLGNFDAVFPHAATTFHLPSLDVAFQ